MIITPIFYAQTTGKIGINTVEPKATLHIQSNSTNSQETSNTNEGVLVPKLTKNRVANILGNELVEGTVVYVRDVTYTGNNTKVAKIDSKGYYFYNGTEWVKLVISGGDIGSNGKDSQTTVTGLQNYPVSSNKPQPGQVLKYINNAWTPVTMIVKSPNSVEGSFFTPKTIPTAEILLPNRLVQVDKSGQASYSGELIIQHVRAGENNDFPIGTVTTSDSEIDRIQRLYNSDGFNQVVLKNSISEYSGTTTNGIYRIGEITTKKEVSIDTVLMRPVFEAVITFQNGEKYTE